MSWEWISNNAQLLATLIMLGFGLVVTWALLGADIKQLKKDTAEIKAEVHELVKVTQAHRLDTTLHIDPHRDDKRWDDLKSEIFRRFDGMEGKIEKLMIIHPPGPLA